MVGETFSVGYHFGVNDFLDVKLMHKHVPNEGPMIWPRMHPGCFKSVLLLEDVGDDKFLLSAKLQQKATIVVAVTKAVSATYFLPGICILAHSSIEINKDYYHIVCRGALETATELRVELIFFLQV